MARIPGESPMELTETKAADGSSKDEPSSREDQLEDTLRRFNFLAALRERQQIRRVCVDSLRIYRQVEVEMPQSSRMERYMQVVERRISADPRAASKIMRLVKEGFAHWPAERPLNFRDVVQIIAETDCLTTHVAGSDVQPRDVDFVFDIISEVIPAYL
ncbi:MAG TPA: hypothetical protein VN325_27945 [Steroidobacteraceae bacterium]|nr:hypothetical protein [Steroidobacteraceae bacterium]